jgi:hypothetical protein
MWSSGTTHLKERPKERKKAGKMSLGVRKNRKPGNRIMLDSVPGHILPL